MPYRWMNDERTELALWPHQSMTPIGFVGFIAATAVMFLIPVFGVFDTVVFWFLMPFILAIITAIWIALRRSQKKHQCYERLSIGPVNIVLVHHAADGSIVDWRANIYWVQIGHHPSRGPVEDYITLKGAGREVEIGAFLSADERLSLRDELQQRLHQLRARNRD